MAVRPGVVVVSLAVGMGLATLVIPQWSVASPQGFERTTVWQKARQPSGRHGGALLDAVDRKREPKDETFDSEAIRTQLHRAAATLLELAGVETQDDVELLYLYGECLTYAGGQYAARARAVLEQALTLAPHHPNAANAWDSLGRVNMALGAYAAGYRAYEKALEREWNEEVRTAILIEQGLGALRAQQLSVAIERLRSARSDAGNTVAWALSQWALAVAMDRGLFGPEALRLAWQASQARFGPSGTQDVLSLPEVAFEPPAEVFYFRALAATGKAQVGPPQARRDSYQEAKFLWLRYLDAVGPTGPWLSRVERHLAEIDRVLAKLFPDEDDDLDRQARETSVFDTSALGGTDIDAGAELDPLWPEELEQGARFWGKDGGT